MQPQAMRRLVQFAKKVEHEMYEQAGSKDDYYHRLAEKIYKIHKELEQRNKDRETERLRAENGGADKGSTGEEATQPSETVGDMPEPAKAENFKLETVQPDSGIKVEAGSVAAPSVGPDSIKKEPITTIAGQKRKPNDSISDEERDPRPPTGRVKIENIDCPITQEVLVEDLSNIWQQINDLDDSYAFRERVDPIALQIPDYLKVIKKPMDLGTIKNKLDSGQYQDHWDFVDDMHQMFRNGHIYNKKPTRIYKSCTRLKETFEKIIDGVMLGHGYCCSESRVFNPLPIACWGKPCCSILTNTTYWMYEQKDQFHGTGTGLPDAKYFFCDKCFRGDMKSESKKKKADENVVLGSYEPGENEVIRIQEDSAGKPLTVLKSKFEEKRNNHFEPESYTSCKKCNKRFHTICITYSNSVYKKEGYTCETCRNKHNIPKAKNKYTPATLPKTEISSHIENRVNDYLEKVDSGGEHGKVHVRTLFIGKKSFTMRDELARELKKEDPDVETEFPYTVKVIFAWEEIDDTPVCFWGLHVQEYGSDTADPNKRRVYISYLDSVFFFRPKRLRTDVYHEILISYLEYCRQLGFFWGHIWACPPSEGDDYIFHCHPEAQKVPKPKRLQEWYKKMLEKAQEKRVIEKFDSILAHAKNQESDEPYKTMAYFDGDFWPNAIEDMVKEVDNEKIEREKQEAEEAQEEAKLKEISEQGDGDLTVSQPGPDGKNPSKKNSSNKMKKTKNKKKKNAKEKEHSYKNDLCAKMFGQLERYADMFFVIQLQTDEDMRNPTPIKDPDELKANELMDGRDPFLCMAREKHWEFSSLRRSKWSSIEFLFELHNTEKGSDGYTCNICQTRIEGIRWNCKTCEDYDICDKCKKAKPNSLCGHELQSQDAVDERKQNWNKYIKALEHASTCRNTNCKIAHCQRMRKLIGHTRECKQRAGGCTLCRQLVMLCCHHAKTCKNDSCTIPYCSKIKDKFKQQQGRNNQRNLRALQQRAQLMNTGGQPRPVQSSSSSEVKEETNHSSYTGNGNPGTVRLEIANGLNDCPNGVKQGHLRYFWVEKVILSRFLGQNMF